MRCWLVGLCALAGVSVAQGAEVVSESLRFMAFETRTMTVPATLSGGQDVPWLRTKMQIKGLVTRPEQVLEVRGERYAELDMLVAAVQADYCKSKHVPAGESTFNAGRNISASLGDYVPSQLRIEIRYHLSTASQGRTATRKTSLLCPNSMRE